MARRLHGSPSRCVIELLARKHMTRQEIYEKVSRDLVPSKNVLRTCLNYLRTTHRIVPYLPVGKVKKIDPWVYKLNPMEIKRNLPEKATRRLNRRIRELKLVLTLKEDQVRKLVQIAAPEPSFLLEEDAFDPTKE